MHLHSSAAPTQRCEILAAVAFTGSRPSDLMEGLVCDDHVG